jgi:predicted phosphodiesterase/biotin operon repressor
MEQKPTPDQLRALRVQHGSIESVYRAIGVPRDTVRTWYKELGDKDAVAQLAAVGEETVPTAVFDDAVLSLIRRKKAISVEGLSDTLDVAPKAVRAALDRLQEAGYRVPEQQSGQIILAPVHDKNTKVHKSLLDGDEITFGVVSDTHLSSKECALAHLHLAYDTFMDQGITEVYHSGDIVAGRGIYRTQDQDLTHFTFESQVNHAVDNYPKRDGIRTVLIGGNHDLEGDFGKLGADPCVAIANRRDDIDYIGAYSGTIQLVNGAFVQLVHGRGGGGYAVSYKPQKYVEGLSPGRKPALIIFGHWHISGFFRHRNVSLLLGGCFEFQTSLLIRLGLQPDVGFWIMTMRLAEDGSVVAIKPEWHPFYEGRELAVA